MFLKPPGRFDSTQASFLRGFLGARERPQGTLSYGELCGFLYAICCSPEMVQASEWLPLVFNDQSAGYRDEAEAQQVLSALMALYNFINGGVLEKEPGLPSGCEASRATMANFEDDAGLRHWARGFLLGHDYLSELWEAYLPDELDEDMGACMMALSFFASRELATDYWQEVRPEGLSLEEFAADMLELFPEALLQYALMGRSIADVVERKQQPARSSKIGRNDPCPCGSGKEYKNCCGSSLH
jgi:uncharacterized protein